jgi:hypothetical protein
MIDFSDGIVKINVVKEISWEVVSMTIQEEPNPNK